MFLEPVFLWGLGAASVPILIHMMQSPRTRTLDFPTIRFLKACQKRATRRTRIKNLLLLLLRIALFVLLALAFAKPWREHEKSAVRPDALVSMVIVLDNSYSMGYGDKGMSRFEQARQAALGLLETLKPGDEVAVLLMNEEVVPVLPDFTADPERARQALRQAALSVRGTDADPALREALRLANKAKAAAAVGISDSRLPISDWKPGSSRPSPAPESAIRNPQSAIEERPRRREIHILTDLQASAWEKTLKSGFLKTTDTDASLYVTSFGRKGSPNAFIESAAITSTSPEAATITASVRAVGAGSPGNVLTLNVDGRNVVQESFAVRPGAPASVPLTVRLAPTSPHRCVLSLQDDSLAIDDRYYFTVQVGERSKVLVVDGDPSAIPHLAETFFLAHALNPGTATGGEGPAPIDSQVVSAADFPNAKLDDFRTVVLCNVPPPADDAPLLNLEGFLRGGGAVMVFLGDRVSAEEYNKWKFLPVSLTGPLGDPSKRESFGFGEKRDDHPLFRSPVDVRSARFFLCYGSAPGSLKQGAVVIQRFANGQPALIEGRLDKGRVLLFTSTCDLAWNNFPLRRAFLPWLHQALYYLSSQETKGNAYRLKDEVKLQALLSHYRSGGRITVTDPSGQRTALTPQITGAYAEAVYKGTEQPGMYLVAADPAFTNSGGFGVNLDVNESVIDMADPEKIVSSAAPGLVRFVDGPRRSIVEEVRRTREGKEYWKTLLQIAFLMFLVESLFANFISRGKKATGSKTPLFEVLKQRSEA